MRFHDPSFGWRPTEMGAAMGGIDRHWVEEAEFSNHLLIELRGRPAFPWADIDRVLNYPGKYRDIMSFWQCRPEEVLPAQLASWIGFLERRKQNIEASGFSNYREGVTDYLNNSGWAILSTLLQGNNAIMEDETLQRRLTTWVEYFVLEFSFREEEVSWLQENREKWDAAWYTLVHKDVLSASEAEPESALRICERSSCDIAKEKQLLDEIVAQHYQERGELRYGRQKREKNAPLKTTYGMETAVAKADIDNMCKRRRCIAKFMQMTHKFRLMMRKASQRDWLLTWILQQIQDIAKDECIYFTSMNSELRLTITDHAESAPIKLENKLRLFEPFLPKATKSDRPFDFVTTLEASWPMPPAQSDDNGSNEPQFSFARFMQLPPETRRQIWIDALPPEPTAHFFQVVVPHRPPELVHDWSSWDFSLRATGSYSSGYKTVYKLVAVCKESRELIWFYYMLKGAQGVPSPELIIHRPVDFRTFDWIPTQDLIVLCLPPVVGEMPEQDAISLEVGWYHGARHVALLMSRELTTLQMSNDISDLYMWGRERQDHHQFTCMRDMLSLLRSKGRREKQGIQAAEMLADAKSASTCSIPDGSGGGIGRLYVAADAWRATVATLTAPTSSSRLAAWMEGPVEWRLDAKHSSSTHMISRDRLSALDASRQSWDTEALEKTTRHGWWLASGERCLALHEGVDLVEKGPFQKIESFMAEVATETDTSPGWGEFVGSDILGWIG